MKALRLIRPNGEPAATHNDDSFLREMFRYDQQELADAMLLFTHGMLENDPVATYAGVQKLAVTAARMQDIARDWARERARG